MVGILSNEEEEMITDGKFKFILYVSFPNKDESIALELCELADNLCKDLGKDIFSLNVRLSEQNKQRWNKDFLSE